MVGTYVIYLDIGRDDYDDYDDGESRDEDNWVIYRYPSVDTMKLRKTLKNMGKVLPKIVKNSIFSKIKLPGLLMKNRASFPTNICPVF